MLTYLDALIEALVVRDTPEAERLLAHPLARILTEDVRAEAEALRDGRSDPLAAPLRLLQLRHQTAELLRDAPVVADRAEAPDPLEALIAPRLQRSPPPALAPRGARKVHGRCTEGARKVHGRCRWSCRSPRSCAYAAPAM